MPTPCRVLQVELDFDGATYDPAQDRGRLQRQLDRVRRALADGEWLSLAELAARTQAPEASVSARLRDLRKPRHGALTVEARRREGGVWEYRLQIDQEERHAR